MNPPPKSIPEGVTRQVILASRPDGEPRPEHFSVIDIPRARPLEGQVSLQTLWLSLDPYMRLRMDDRESYAPSVKLGEPMVGAAVASVVESRVAGLRPGDLVEARIGWQSHSVANAADLRRLDMPVETARQSLGVLGMTGLTAYCGLLDIGKPLSGDTVVVGAATGAVGSVVGQIARLLGCRVVGIAGGSEKCRLAVAEYGFDACIDHRSPSLPEDLAAACPDGVDIYFENIGGAVLEAVLPLLNVGARIPLCGLISQYNGEQSTTAHSHLSEFLLRILERRLTVRGFIITDLAQKRPVFERDMRRWIADGLIQYRECVTVGLEHAPAAFIRMLRGENIGKTLVQVAPDVASSGAV